MAAEANEAPVLGAPLTLAGARHLAATALRTKAHGRDPAREAQAQRGNGAVELRFADVALAYVHDCRKRNRSWTETARTLGLDSDLAMRRDGLAALWQGRALASLTTQDTREQFEQARSDGIPGRRCWKSGYSEARARQMHVVLSGLFAWAVRMGKLERSPLNGLAAPTVAKPRDRVLAEAEIAALWAASDVLSPWDAAVVRLLLCTGARLQEMARLKFAELSDGSIALSGERTKKKRATPHAAVELRPGGYHRHAKDRGERVGVF